VGAVVGFLAAGLVVVTLIHYYLWRRLVRATTRPGPARRVGTALLVFVACCLVAAVIGTRVLPHRIEVVLAWPGYLWLALMFYLLLTFAALEIPALLARRLVLDRRRPADTPPTRFAATPLLSAGPEVAESRGADESRRLFLARSVAITAGLAAAGVTGSGIATAMGPPRLKRIQIPLAKLARTADGLRIALVADIHLGPLRGRATTERIVQLINGLDADLVAVVGDLVDGTVAELGPAVVPLRDLRSRYGSFFVTGNHEYYSGYRQWIDEVAELGLRPLRNELVPLPAGLDLAGVNDATGASNGDPADYDRALSGHDPDRAVVLLAHQPVQAHEAARRGVDLQLSGHTHGGQFVPFNLVVGLQQPVVSGLGRVDGMPVYVTNGAGFWGPPVRVGAPPDVSLVELRAAR
jgi:uncharacterized protein